MNEGKIKFAVIGYGHIGKRHAAIISKNPEAELVAICDVKTKEQLNFDEALPLFTSIDDLLDTHPEVEVVNICTPNAYHADHAIFCLEHGKHVVVEKPMALKRKDSEKMISKATVAGRDIFVVMQNRYSPPAKWLKEIVDSGKLGKVFFVQVNCFWNRDESYYTKESWHGNKLIDGGTLFTQFSHFIDIAYWLFGDITNVRSTFTDFNHQQLTEFEDSGFVTFEFVNGGIGNFNYSTSVFDRNFESSLTVIAENGTVKIGGQYMNKVEYCQIKNYKMPSLAETSQGNDYGSYSGSAANHHLVIQNVIDVIKGRSSITTKADEGMKVVEIIQKIYASGKSPKKYIGRNFIVTSTTSW